MKRPVLVAITLDSRGGGIATASRLLWRAFRETWPGDCRVVTLLRDERPLTSLHAPMARRLQFGARLAWLQATNQVDWLLFSHLSLATVQRLVPAGARKPYAVFLHDVEAWDPMPERRHAALAGAAVRLSNSRYTARRVMEAHPAAGTVEPCHLALPDAPASTPLASGVRRALVLTVGRMISTERYKGHDQLLQAWPAVRARVPDAELVCAGAGDDIPRLRAVARSLGEEGSVRFPGFVTEAELAALYREAAVFAMPSRREGFGLVYLEAMSHGIPCLASIHDAAGEIVLDGETGFLVDQQDGAAIADRLVRLLRDPDLRTGMGARGRARATSEFSFDRFAHRLGLLIGRDPLVSGAGALAGPERP